MRLGLTYHDRPEFGIATEPLWAGQLGLGAVPGAYGRGESPSGIGDRSEVSVLHRSSARTGA